MQKGFIGYLNSNRYKVQSKIAGKRQQRKIKHVGGGSKQTKLNKQRPACGVRLHLPCLTTAPSAFYLPRSHSKDAWLEPSTKTPPVDIRGRSSSQPPAETSARLSRGPQLFWLLPAATVPACGELAETNKIILPNSQRSFQDFVWLWRINQLIKA